MKGKNWGGGAQKICNGSKLYRNMNNKTIGRTVLSIIKGPQFSSKAKQVNGG